MPFLPFPAFFPTFPRRAEGAHSLGTEAAAGHTRAVSDAGGHPLSSGTERTVGWCPSTVLGGYSQDPPPHSGPRFGDSRTPTRVGSQVGAEAAHLGPPSVPPSSCRAGVLLSEALRLRWPANSLEGAQTWPAPEAGQGAARPAAHSGCSPSTADRLAGSPAGTTASSPPQPRLPRQGARGLGPSPPSAVPSGCVPGL